MHTLNVQFGGEDCLYAFYIKIFYSKFQLEKANRKNPTDPRGNGEM